MKQIGVVIFALLVIGFSVTFVTVGLNKKMPKTGTRASVSPFLTGKRIVSPRNSRLLRIKNQLSRNRGSFPVAKTCFSGGMKCLRTSPG